MLVPLRLYVPDPYGQLAHILVSGPVAPMAAMTPMAPVTAMAPMAPQPQPPCRGAPGGRAGPGHSERQQR